MEADPFQRSSADTPEAMIHEHDMMRVQDFEDLHREMDERLMALEAQDAGFDSLDPVEEEEAGGFSRGLKKAGLVTYVVFSVVFALGMKALPFLV